MALERLRRSGRKTILVTGRRLPELQEVFPHLQLFDRVVVENGALLFHPARNEERLLAAPLPGQFVDLLRRERVEIATGRVVIATRRPHDHVIRRIAAEMGLAVSIIFNKEAVMVLPPGVDKGTGMEAALEEVGVSWKETVAMGDAENDADFLVRSGVSVAVANALPSVRQLADFVAQRSNGEGVVEMIRRMFDPGISGEQ